MPDVFSRSNDSYKGSFAADGAAITFPQFGMVGNAGIGGLAAAGGAGALAAQPGGAGLLVQNINLQYSQVITKVYELGTNNIYYIGGRTQGGMGMSRIIGPRPIQVSFYTKFGDICDAATNNIDISVRTGCPTTDGQSAGSTTQQSTWSAKFCVIQSLGMGVAAMDMVINEQLQLMFGSLTLQA